MSRLYDLRWWRRFSQNYLRQNPLCVMCTARGITRAATQVDHIDPHKGDMDKFRNGPFQSLCGPCHGAVKSAFERSGTIRGCSVDGVPIARN